MLVMDYRRDPGGVANLEPPLIVVEPCSGCVVILDDDNIETPPQAPHRSGRRTPRPIVIEWWLGLAGAAAMLLLCVVPAQVAPAQPALAHPRGEMMPMPRLIG